MLVSSFLPCCIVNEIVGMQAELRSDKLDHLRRNQLAWSQHPTGITQDAQLQGEAEPVVSSPALPDVPEILIAQRIVFQQIRLRSRQPQQRVLLLIG
jgi:hypothetical protein